MLQWRLSCDKLRNMLRIHGLNKLSLVDYPGLMSAIVFTGCCNFRCPFCHNSSLVLDPSSQPVLDVEEILSFLERRKGMLDGVVVTGGEPTIHDDLPQFIRSIKDLGYLVKLDTNGSRPDMVRRLVEAHLVDYIAMDIKNSLDRYGMTVGIPDFDTTPIRESVDYIRGCGVDYEFRTTVVTGLHYEENFHGICHLIAPCRRYFLQTFVPSQDTIAQGLSAPSRSDMEKYLELVRSYIGDACIRDSRD